MPGQMAFLAIPEKALLDLIYLTPGADSREYLRELRLQNLDHLDWQALAQIAEKSRRPKLIRAVKCVKSLADNETYEEL